MVNSPITESLQIRVYREIRGSETPSALHQSVERSGQDSYEIELSRPRLFAGQAGGLRAVRRDEEQFPSFGSFGPDTGRPEQYLTLDRFGPVLGRCAMCHQGPGIYSLNTRVKLIKPHALQKDPPAESFGPHWWQDSRTLSWKERREDWARLSADWRGSSQTH
jgi:hypothetical protein